MKFTRDIPDVLKNGISTLQRADDEVMLVPYPKQIEILNAHRQGKKKIMIHKKRNVGVSTVLRYVAIEKALLNDNFSIAYIINMSWGYRQELRIRLQREYGVHPTRVFSTTKKDYELPIMSNIRFSQFGFSNGSSIDLISVEYVQKNHLNADLVIIDDVDVPSHLNNEHIIIAKTHYKDEKRNDTFFHIDFTREF